MKIKIATDFSTAPGPRYIVEGEHSGQLFRTEYLLPKFKEALESGVRLTVELDGTSGYGTSFLEEAFGGLIRENGFTIQQMNSTMQIISIEEPGLLEEIRGYMEEAEEERGKKP